MTTVSPNFLVREAIAEGDDQFIIGVFDAAIPYLVSIGSHEQWGTTPFSQRKGWIDETEKQIKEAQGAGFKSDEDASGRLRIFIVERECDAESDTLDVTGIDSRHFRVSAARKSYVSVGFAFVRENWFPGYVASQTHLEIPKPDRESNVYLELMATDSRVGALRHGAGRTLIQWIRDYGRREKKKGFWLDGWAGNDEKLIRYYQHQGFRVVGKFSLPRDNKAPWVGTLMRMDIG